MVVTIQENSISFGMVEIHVTCLFFAESRAITGLSQKQYTIPLGTTSRQFIELLQNDFPSLRKILPNCILSINQEYVDKSNLVELKEADEIAVIPPLSGG